MSEHKISKCLKCQELIKTKGRVCKQLEKESVADYDYIKNILIALADDQAIRYSEGRIKITPELLTKEQALTILNLFKGEE